MIRLAEAIRLIERTTGPAGPRGYVRAMPDYEYSALDLWYQAMQSAAEIETGRRSRNRVRLGAAADEIAQADDALRWPRQYVRYEDRRRALMLWLRSRAEDVSFKGLIARSGLAHRTVIRHRDEALDAIVEALNRPSCVTCGQLVAS